MPDGLEIRLEAPLKASERVHKGAFELSAQLSATFLVPQRAFGWTGLGSFGSHDDEVAVSNWRPSQNHVQDLAGTRKFVMARGRLDWGGRRSHRDPTGPWVGCQLDANKMMLRPHESLTRYRDGRLTTSRTEGELELSIGLDLLKRTLQDRETARVSWTGPGLGHVDGVTTWPMEQGGPCPQEFERFTLDLALSDEGMRVTGQGQVGPGGDLGPAVTMDFVIPALWLKLSGFPMKQR